MYSADIPIFTAIFFFPVALQSFLDPGRLTYRRFLELFRHMVGLLGRVISPSQGLYLHRTTQHRKTRDKHPCLKRDSNPRSQQPIGQDPRLRPHGHLLLLPSPNIIGYKSLFCVVSLLLFSSVKDLYPSLPPIGIKNNPWCNHSKTLCRPAPLHYYPSCGLNIGLSAREL
jgi:hypothetical protein